MNPPSEDQQERLRHDNVEGTIDKALQVVGSHSYIAMSRNATFDQLGQILLQVAKALADINSSRIIQAEQNGGTIGRLSELYYDHVKSVLQFGMAVAAQMQDRLQFHDEEKGRSRRSSSSLSQKLDTSFSASSLKKSKGYDIFVSFAGEERLWFQPYLAQAFKQRAPRLKVFFDSLEMGSAQTSDVRRAMFEACLTADCVLCVVSVDYVKKPWPMAELLIGLSRNSSEQDKSHLFLDAMPGTVSMMTRFNQGSNSWNATGWVDDLKSLLPMSPQPMITSMSQANGMKLLVLVGAINDVTPNSIFNLLEISKGIEHVDYVVDKLWTSKTGAGSYRDELLRLDRSMDHSSFSSSATSITPPTVGVLISSDAVPALAAGGEYSTTPEAIVFGHIFAITSISKSDMEDILLSGETRPCTFSIRASLKQPKYKSRFLRVAVCTVVKKEPRGTTGLDDALAQFLWTYDDHNGEFGRVHLESEKEEQVENHCHTVKKIVSYPTMSGLLLSLGALYFKSHPSHVRDMCDFMVQAAEKARSTHASAQSTNLIIEKRMESPLTPT